MKVSIYQVIAVTILGFFLGLANHFFLIGLNRISSLRDQNTWLIWLLPLAGFLIVLIRSTSERDWNDGMALVRRELSRDREESLPKFLGPFTLLATLITHLFGGSAGREGTAVQLSVWISDILKKKVKLSFQDIEIHRIAAGVGFAVATGAPLAGFLFSLEFFNKCYKKISSYFVSVYLIIVAIFIQNRLETPHLLFPKFSVRLPSWRLALILIFIGVIFGIVAKAYIRLYHFVKHFVDNRKFNPQIKIIFGGFLISFSMWLEGSYLYTGLGLETIQNSFTQNQSPHVFAFKCIFTILTMSFGFRGGEFIPMVFVGSTLGSYLSSYVPSEYLVSVTGVGSVAMYSSIARIPWTGVFLGLSWFGLPFLWIGAPILFLASWLTGKARLYD